MEEKITSNTINAVLIVEDDIFIADLYRLQFEQKGIKATIAHSGTEGIQMAQKTAYDVILLDVMLPGLDGIETLRALKQDESCKNIPVVLCSNIEQENIVKQGMELGALAYLVKASYTPRQMYEKIMSLLSETKPSSTT